MNNLPAKKTLKEKIVDTCLEIGISISDVAAVNDDFSSIAPTIKTGLMGLRVYRDSRRALTILEEEKKMLNQKVIKQEDVKSHYNEDMLQSIFNIEANQVVDETKFNLLKKLILVGLTKDEKGRVQAQHFFHVISSLSTSEILVLVSCYHFSTTDTKWRDSSQDNSNKIVQNWREAIANHSGLGLQAMVEEVEDKLVQKKLLHSLNQLGQVNKNEYFRMTEYGFKLLKFAEEYDKLSS